MTKDHVPPFIRCKLFIDCDQCREMYEYKDYDPTQEEFYCPKCLKRK